MLGDGGRFTVHDLSRGRGRGFEGVVALAHSCQLDRVELPLLPVGGLVLGVEGLLALEVSDLRLQVGQDLRDGQVCVPTALLFSGCDILRSDGAFFPSTLQLPGRRGICREDATPIPRLQQKPFRPLLRRPEPPS